MGLRPQLWYRPAVFFALLPLLGGPAFAAGDEESTGPQVERITGPVPKEVEALHAVHARFTARVDEFKSDTRAFIGAREKAERDRLVLGYDSLLDELTELESNQRVLAIERFEDFLSRHGDESYASHVRLRLAELYFEDASEDWLIRSREYFRLAERGDLSLEEQEMLGEEPKINLARSVALYQRIVDDNRDLPAEEQYANLDAVYYMLGFSFMEVQSAQFNEVAARDVFEELVGVRSHSEFADGGHLFLGNFMFNENEFEESIAEYEIVLSHGKDGKYYYEATYQLAWAYYKLSEYDKALALFTELLDHSEEQLKETGRPSSYEPDAIKFMGHSFADISDRQVESPVKVAKDYFGRSTPRDYEWGVYKALGEILTQYGRSDEAVEVYQNLQTDPRWVLRPENPEFQMKVVQLLGTGIYADLAAAASARLEFTRNFAEGADWYEANRTNPDALAVTNRFIEESLLDVAIEYHVRAQETGAAEDYARAAEEYKRYIDKFPLSDDYYEQVWYMADTLFKAKDFPAAELEYENLIRASKYHKFGDGSIYMLSRVRHQLFIDQIGPPDKPDASAGIERTYTTPDGVEIQVHELRGAHTKFIEAADQVLVHEFGPRQPNLPDFQGEADKQAAAFQYIPAQIMFYANRFDESRPRLQKIMDEMPQTREAALAARLLVDSYLAEGDLQNVARYTRLFKDKRFGVDDLALADESAAIFRNTLERSAYQLATGLAKQGDFEGAALAYVAFFDEFDDSVHVADAMISAAINFERMGQAGRANEIFEDFVDRFPAHEDSQGLYSRIASNYEATFELDKAIDYYDRLVANFPNSEYAPDALYMRSFLNVGLGEHEVAARGFEKYAKNYRETKTDHEIVFFAAGREWERVGDKQALDFYRRYLKTYDIENANNAVEAKYKIYRLQVKLGEKRPEKTLDELVEMFDRILDAGANLGGAGRDHVAEAAFRDVQAAYDGYIVDELSRDETKDAELLERKEAQLLEFIGLADAFTAKYTSFHYTAGARYLQAGAIAYLSKLGLGLEPPSGFTEDQQWAYWDILEERIFPKYHEFQEKAIERYVSVTDLSRSLKRHSDYVTMSYDELNLLEPATYPAQKVEVYGGVNPQEPPTVRPVSMEPAGGKP